MMKCGSSFLVTLLFCAAVPSAKSADAVDIKNVTFLKRKAESSKNEASSLASILEGGLVQANNTLGREIILTDKIFASVGRGYNSITGEILDGECIVSDKDDDKFGFGRIEKTTYYHDKRIVKDIETHEQVSAFKADFGFAAKSFGVGLSSEGSRGNYFNSVDSFARLYAQIVTQGRDRYSHRFSQFALDLLDKGVEDFISQCGTSFVRGVYSGHRLDETMRFKLTSRTDIVKDSKGLALNIGKFLSAGGGTADTEKALREQSTNDSLSQGRGAYGIPNEPTNLENGLLKLVSYYESGFVAAVKSDVNNVQAAPLYIEVESYSMDPQLVFPVGKKLPTWTEEIMSMLIGRLPLFTKLQNEISEIDYALSPEAAGDVVKLYAPETIATITTKQDLARKMLVDVQGAVKVCNDLVSGKDSTNAFELCKAKFDAAIDDVRVKAVALARAVPASP